MTGVLTGDSWKTWTINSSLTSYSNIQLSWSVSQDIAANTNTVDWTLKFLNRKNSSSGDGLGSSYYRTVTDWTVRVGKSSSSYTTYSSSGSVSAYNNYTLRTGTTTITAEDDGSCDLYIYIQAHIGGSGSSYATTNNITTTLDQIPRDYKVYVHNGTKFVQGVLYVHNGTKFVKPNAATGGIYVHNGTGFTKSTFVG